MAFQTTLNHYQSFFGECKSFAFSPYTRTFMSVATRCDRDASGFTNAVTAGALVCAALTVIPVLPIATLFTASLAMIGALLAAATAVFALPIAGLMDCCAPDRPAKGLGSL